MAVRVAALLADAPGVELTSAARPEDPEPSEAAVVLALTLEGTTEAVTAALAAVEAELPPGATIALAGPRG